MFHAVLIVTCVLLMQMEPKESVSSVLLALYFIKVLVNNMLRAVEKNQLMQQIMIHQIQVNAKHVWKDTKLTAMVNADCVLTTVTNALSKDQAQPPLLHVMNVLTDMRLQMSITLETSRSYIESATLHSPSSAQRPSS